MSQEPLQVPPKLQPSEMDTITEALYRSDDPPTLLRDTPLVRPQPDPDLPDPGRYEKRAKPKRAQRERLLDRRDWQTIVIITAIVGVATFVAAFLGVVAGLFAT